MHQIKDIQKMTILVVEDDAVCRMMVNRILEPHYQNVIVVESAEQAWDVVQQKPPDLILLDINLPGMNGYEFCRQIREKEVLRFIPIIFMTASQESETIKLSFEAGGSDYISKPINYLEVLSRVKAALTLKQTQEQAQEELLWRQKAESEVRQQYEMLKKAHMELESLYVQLNEALTQVKAANEEIQQMVITDDLTKLFNRRYFFSRLMEELKRAQRYNHSFSCVMVDIDYFKTVNDQYGHQTGDIILSELSKIIKAACRTSDIVARYGGEEFIILLPETSEENSLFFAQKIRKLVKECRAGHRNNDICVTVSIGVAGYPEHGETGEEIVRAADEALYRAKQEGRDRVCAAYENASCHNANLCDSEISFL
jgi:two-component system, cell cycle response regulator